MRKLDEEKNTLLFIPEFTAEDFLASTAPFEYVYQFHNDKFAEIRAIEKVSQLAYKFKIRNFKRMYDEYLKSCQQLHEPTVNYTQFENQPFELCCGDWQADNTGVYCYSTFKGTEIACSHPIMPVQRLINIDTGMEKVKLAFQKGNRWREIIVEKSVISTANKIVNLSDNGIGVTSENSKLLVRYLSDVENANYDIIPESYSFSRLGHFDGEGFVPYVDKLVFDGDLNFRTIYRSIIQKGDRKLWLNEIKKIRKYSTPAKIVIAASLASVLVPVCNAQVFFTHLWSSTSGTGKTVALMCAASVWANPELGKYIQTFNSTQVGLERFAAFLNHLPLMIDELQLGSSQKFSVYQLSEGVGRTRGNKTGGVDRTATWANAVITTGETPLIRQSEGSGAYNRTIDIECVSSEKVIEDGQHTTSVIKNNYGFAGRDFVELLYSSETMTDMARCEFQQSYRELCKNDTTEKQAMAAALILTADKLFCQWILGMSDFLTVDDISKYLATKREVSVGERGYNYVCDWIGANQNRFATSNRIPENGEIYGIFGSIDNYVYIIRNIFIRTVEQEGYNAKSLLSYFKENGLISTRGRNMTKGKRINGNLVECVALKMPETEDDNSDNIDFDDDFI